jgi:prepilin-type N-terminal cleavage/methylation domain-containing protein
MSTFIGGIGIDISEHHIRITQMGMFGSITKTTEITLPDGWIVDEEVLEKEEVQKKIDELFKKEKIGHVRAALLLPESRVFSTSFLLPTGTKGEAVQTQALERAQRDIPIPFAQAVTSVSQGERTENGIQTTVYAMEQKVFDGFAQLFEHTQIKIVAIEANTKGVHRLLKNKAKKNGKKGKDGKVKRKRKDVMMVVDVGHSWATMSVYTPKGSNLYSRTISYRHVGEGLAGKEALPGEIVELLTGAIKDAMVYFDQQELSIQHMYLSGVEALDTALRDAFKGEEFKELQPQWIGDVLPGTQLTKKKIHQFGPSIGAAMRAVHPFRYRYQHNFSQHLMQTKQKGFTLVELLVVIAIIGILVAIIFVALDPAARFGQARDAVRQNDVQEVLSSIKLYQVDNGGAHLASINGLTNGEVYMAVNGATMAAGCDDNNANCTTNVTSDTHCVDIAGLITGGYLDSMPVSPAGLTTWDDGDTSGEEGSGYTISKDANGIVTVRACEDEQTTTEIEAAR